MRKMKKLLSGAAGLFMAAVLTVVCRVPAAYANSAIDDARQSVVRVWAQGVGTGTAFIVAQSGTSTVMVTNFHVVAGGAKVYILPTDITGAWIEAQVTYLQDGLDLAILTTTAGLSGRPVLPLGDISQVRAADPVYAIGFPGAADAIIDYGDWLPSSADDATVTRGIVSSVLAVRNSTDAIQHDCFILYGNSGGPLLNEDGAVIGVNTWINPEASGGVNYAIHVKYITDALTEFGIEYKTPAAAASAETPAPSGEPAGPGGLNTASGFSLNRLMSDYWWVLAAAAGGGLVFWLRVKRAPVSAPMPAPAPMPVPSPVPAGSASFHLICSRGHFAGTTFPINGNLFIGRDPRQCQIIFPNNTKGISSVHCELRQQGSGVALTDKGSSYGTFLAGGRKLNAHETVVLKSGDSFYLADTKNEFKVL